MLRLYSYLYYKILRCVELLDDEIPSFIALGILCVINSFQLIIIDSIILYFLPEFDNYRNTTTGLITGIAIFGSNWFLFEYNAKWRKIYERFEKESMRSNIIGTSLVLLFIVLSIWISLKISGPWIVDSF